MKKIFCFFLLMGASLAHAQTIPSHDQNCDVVVADTCTITVTQGETAVIWNNNSEVAPSTLTLDGSPVTVVPNSLSCNTVFCTSLWIAPNLSAGTHTFIVTNLGNDHFPLLYVNTAKDVAIINPLDAYGVAQYPGQTSSAACTPTTSTTVGNDLIYGFAAGFTSSASLGTSTQAMTQVAVAGGNISSWGLVPTAGSFTVGYNFNAEGPGICSVVALKPRPAVDPTVTSIAITPPSVSVESNAKTQFTATAKYSDNSTQDVTNLATWDTSDPTILIVANGLVQPIAQSGTANVTAAYLGFTSPSAAVTILTYVPQTYYTRIDGGTRFSVNVPTGQCDGMADVSYASTGGTGVNQHCAFNDVRYFWTDGTFTSDINAGSPKWGWIGNGEDTYIVRGSIADGITWRIGSNTPTSSFGMSDQSSASIPTPKPGIPGHPTRFLGGNFGSCHAQTERTQLHGGWGLNTVLSVAGANYVDIECLDLTDFSSCGKSGQAHGCSQGPIGWDDFTDTGISFANSTENTTLEDIRVHGFTKSGLAGPTGDGTTMDHIEIVGNASSGWNSDPGSGDESALILGNVLMTNFQIIWNGCAEEYPIVDALPYQDCAAQNTKGGGGYGDGFGTATVVSTAPTHVSFNSGITAYNTQDGLDALHLVGVNDSMDINAVLAYGNMGQQIKIGGRHGVATNNALVGNCNAMRYQIPGTPAGYSYRIPTASTSDFCRASDETSLVTFGQGANTIFDFNTIVTAGTVAVEIECDSSQGKCDDTTLTDWRNNSYTGYLNIPLYGYGPGNGSGELSSYPFNEVGANADTSDISDPLPFTQTGSFYTNNFVLGNKFGCPLYNESAAFCGASGLTDPSMHIWGYGDMSPLSGSSPVVGAGVTLAGLPTDINGTIRPANPTVGAYEPITTPKPTITSIKVSPATNIRSIVEDPMLAICEATFSNGSTNDCPSPVWSNDNHSVATMDASGFIHPVAVGSTTVTATLGSLTSSLSITLVATPIIAIPVSWAVPGNYALPVHVTLVDFSDSPNDFSSTGIVGMCYTLDGSDPVPGTISYINPYTDPYSNITSMMNAVVSCNHGTPYSGQIFTTQQTGTDPCPGGVEFCKDNERDNLTQGATASLLIQNTTTIKAIAFYPGKTTSGLMTSLYTIGAPATITSIQGLPNPGSVALNSTLAMSCVAHMSDSTTRPCPSPTWSSSVPADGPIDAATGIVTGHALGSTVITVASSGFINTSTVEITNAAPTLTGIAVTPPSATLTVGGSPLQIVCTATLTDGTHPSCPSPAWTSSSAFATVDTSGNVTAISAGVAIITASVGGFSSTSTITVQAPTPPTVTSILAGPNPGAITVGSQLQMLCTATLTDGTHPSCSSTVWSSGTPSVGRIDSSTGIVTGLTAGSTVITASSSGFTSTATVNVGTAPPTGFNCMVIGSVEIVGSVLLCK